MTAGRPLRVATVGLILFFLAFPIAVVFIVSFSEATYLTFPPPAAPDLAMQNCRCVVPP